MAGLGFLRNVGTGLGGFMQGFNAQQQQEMQRQLQQLAMQQHQQQMRQQQDEQSAQALAYNAVARGAGGSGGISPLSVDGLGTTDSGAQPPMPGQSSMPAFSPSMKAFGMPQPQQVPQAAPQQPPATGAPTPLMPSSGNDPRGMIPYIRETAARYGVDPEVAVRVAMSEGLGNPVGDKGTSFGAMQLHIGGGMGDNFRRDTGVDPSLAARDPNVERQTIDYALKNAAQTGWGPWHGAARVGIGDRQGLPGGGGSAAAAPMQAARDTARTVAQDIPSSAYGQTSLAQVAQAIEAANPGAPPSVKFLAMAQLQKLLAPDAKMQMQMLMAQNKQDFQVELKLLSDQLARGRQEDKPVDPTKGWDVRTDTDGTQYRYKVGTTEATTLGGQPYSPKGAMRTGTAPRTPDGNALMSDEEAHLAAEQYLAGDKSSIQGWGRGAQGDQNRVKMRSEINKIAKEKGYGGADIAAKMAEFEGVKAGQRTLGTREAGLGVGLQEAVQFAPMAVAASEKVDRTQYPNLNQVIIAAERGTGDENVIRLATAAKSLAAAYSTVLRRGGLPTDAANAQANELLNTAFSKGQFKVAVDQIMLEIQAAEKAPAAVRQQLNRAVTGRAAPEQSAPAQGAAPKMGDVMDGFRFMGGDPKDPKSWTPVQ